MPSYRIEVMKKVLVRKRGGCQPYTLQPVEVGVAGLLVLVFLLVEGSPEGAGRVVRRCRGSVAVGDSRGAVVVCGVAAAVARLLVLQTSNISQLSEQIRSDLVFLLVIPECPVAGTD